MPRLSRIEVGGELPRRELRGVFGPVLPAQLEVRRHEVVAQPRLRGGSGDISMAKMPALRRPQLATKASSRGGSCFQAALHAQEKPPSRQARFQGP